jgi:nucleotidyltransferase substrate binding protein (TIGR01987 family)
MNEPDIRWMQRFSTFERAFLLLGTAISIESPSVIERAGLIKCFKMAFDLSGKLLKDKLFKDDEPQEGMSAKTPREVIKQAFQTGIISSGHDWIEALQDRNLTVHTYQEEIAIAIEARIRACYFPLLRSLYETFKAKREANE